MAMRWRYLPPILLLAGAAVAAQPASDDGRLLSRFGHHALARVETLMAQRNYREAVAALRAMLPKVADRAYDSAVALQTLGFAYHSLDQDGKAVDAFRRALARKALPEGVQRNLRFSLAQLLISRQRFKEGLDYLEPWLARSGSPPAEAYAMAAGASYQLGRYRRAIRYLEQAKAHAEGHREAWDRLLLACYERLGRFRDAAAVLETLVRRHPDRKDYWLQLVAVHQRLHQDRRALAVLQLARARGLLGPGETLQLVRLYLYLGQPYQGASLLAEELEAGDVPGTRANWKLLADGWLLAHEDRRAEAALARALDRGAGAEVALRLGRLRYRRQDWAGAVAALEQAVGPKVAQPPALANLLLGISAEHLGHHARARTALGHALQDPHTRDQARWWLNRIDAAHPVRPKRGDERKQGSGVTKGT
jgi:tetratricopeptide (TPR) repeat protein